MSETELKPLHPFNKHKDSYDFDALVEAYPELAEFVTLNKEEEKSIDFTKSDAVKALNKALLIKDYKVKAWDVPAGYLIPPIPGRVDYIHYVADLLAGINNGRVPRGRAVRVLDLGIGANGIYSLLGNASYGWSFVGVDIDKIALNNIKEILSHNPKFKEAIELRFQPKHDHAFDGVWAKDEYFDLVVCNPPFHATPEEAKEANARKNANLGIPEGVLNFGGKAGELWTVEGELGFIHRMIRESADYKTNCAWFTCLVSKKENLPILERGLRRVKATEVVTLEMTQGQKTSRIICWNFLNEKQQKFWHGRW